MASRVTTRVCAHQTEQEQELLRRIEQVVAEVEDARSQMHRAQEAVHAAKECLMARRWECEAAALRVAELADLLETLQQHVYLL